MIFILQLRQRWKRRMLQNKLLAGEGQYVAGAHKGVILQVKDGDELRPFVGRMWMPSILDKTFKGEL